MASTGGGSSGRRRASTDGGGGSSGGSGKKQRRPANLELEIFHDPNLLAYNGWETEPEPWTASTAQAYVGFPHFDRLWPERCHEQHCKAKGARYNNIEDVDVKWRFLTILRAISNSERWPKNSIPRCILSTMYAEHVLRKAVDWSTLRGNGQFGCLGDTLSVRKPTRIPYSPTPEWFSRNSDLYDEPGQPLPEGREPRPPKWRRSDVHENDAMDMTMQEAFDAMEMTHAVEVAQESAAHIGPSSVHASQQLATVGSYGEREVQHANTELDLNAMVAEDAVLSTNATQPELQLMVENMAQMRDEHYLSITAYETRIASLEARLAALGIHEDGGSNNVGIITASPVDSMTEIRAQNISFRAQKDDALERLSASESLTSDLLEANRLLHEEVTSLKNLPFEAQNMELHDTINQLRFELDDANARAANQNTVRSDNEQLREENGRLKQCLTEAVEERIAMRQSTIMAIARARQYESEFESIVSEWNTNGRLRALLLTSWPLEETMFPMSWTQAEPSLYLEDDRCVNWKLIEDPDHHWDVDEVHDYPARVAGTKLWANPHPICTSSETCAICANPFGPEGFYTVATCGHMYHPQCLIQSMIKTRACYCRAPFHPRLYLQFGVRDFMPKHWVYRPQDFPFDLAAFNGENVEWSWKYNMSKVELWAENQDGPWTRSADKILYAANEMYPNKPVDFPMKLFFYQTLDWHWDSTSMQLKRGVRPPFLNSSGEIAQSTQQLRRQYRGLGDLETTTGTNDLVYEENYHRSRLMLNAIDAILHKVSPEMKTWLEGGPKPRRRLPVSPSSRRYQTRRTAREIAQAGGASTSAALPTSEAEGEAVEGGHIIVDSDSD